MKPLDHLSALDGLRGVAILVVLVHNLRLIKQPIDGDLISLAWVKVGDLGWIGVQLFFVLSGFLITRILLNTLSASNYYSGFYARRALRIMPLYYATLIVWLIVLPALSLVAPHDSSHDGYLWVFLSNWVQPLHPSGSGLAHFWSLAVEEQFYLIWPLAIRWAAGKRGTAAGALWLCGAVALASLAFRVAMLATGWPTEAVYEFTVCRMDALAMGGAVAAAMALPNLRDWLTLRAKWVDCGALAVFLMGAGVSRLYRQTGEVPQTAGYSLLALAFALLVLSIALGRSHPVLRNGFLRAAGKYSYALYVFHYPFKMVSDTWIWPNGLGIPVVVADALRILIASAVVSVLAMLSYRFLEQPILRQKHRFEAV